MAGRQVAMARHNTLSVARKEAVARLDSFVGPKW